MTQTLFWLVVGLAIFSMIKIILLVAYTYRLKAKLKNDTQKKPSNH